MSWTPQAVVGGPQWHQLASEARRLANQSLLELVHAGHTKLVIDAAGVRADFGHQRLDPGARDALNQLAHAAGIERARAAMVGGEVVNLTEGRAAAHVWLRDPQRLATAPLAAAEARSRDLATTVHSGAWRGASGKAITDIIHIGIGGSALGPQLVAAAMDRRASLRWHLLDTIDPALPARLLPTLDPERTLAVIVSKSFTTVESRQNAALVRSWLLERGIPADQLGHHLVAVSTHDDAMAALDIPPANRLPLWDWVGGRYSLWSAAGISVAMAYGPAVVDDLRAGAHAMDQHFLDAPLATNAPVQMALTAIWNGNFLGIGSHAVLPYSRRLRLLPTFLQQLETESNGKRVRQDDGTGVGVHTGQLLWGGEGTPGQHAFHQWLHQGTRAVSMDFVLSGQQPRGAPFDDHGQWLLANGLAQSEALVAGRDTGPSTDPLAAHRAMPGNRPSTTLLLERIDPFSVGALLALYEHKVFCAAMIWGINPFDQWGVELGKQLAGDIHGALTGAPISPHHDPVTRARIQYLRSRRPPTATDDQQ